jgi:hypothetical protein
MQQKMTEVQLSGEGENSQENAGESSNSNNIEATAHLIVKDDFRNHDKSKFSDYNYIDYGVIAVEIKDIKYIPEFAIRMLMVKGKEECINKILRAQGPNVNSIHVVLDYFSLTAMNPSKENHTAYYGYSSANLHCFFRKN